MLLEPDERYQAVCEKCMVIAPVQRGWINGYWSSCCICPICGNGDTQLGTDDCGMTLEELEGNYNFYLFTKGIDYAPISGRPNTDER
jgi:hypothetical protein